MASNSEQQPRAYDEGVVALSTAPAPEAPIYAGCSMNMARANFYTRWKTGGLDVGQARRRAYRRHRAANRLTAVCLLATCNG